MVLSQKSQYAVRAVFQLARTHGSGTVKAARIAEAEHIPLRFLENILSQLRQAGIVESVRGKDGGYRLARSPGRVSVGEVVRLVQGPILAPGCAEPEEDGLRFVDGESACPLRRGCVLLPMWERAHRAMMDVYDETSFKDLVEQERAANAQEVIDYAI